MIYRDSNCLPVTSSLDGGDSSLRAGILSLFGANKVCYHYETDGLVRRHPAQEPWNNFWNMSRDNTIPLLSGLYAEGEIKACARVFWKTIRRGCFAQNFERDWPGTTKHPYPSIMSGGDPVDNGKWRMFDFADPILPHQLFFMALCGKVWQFYWLALIAYPLMFLSLVFNSRLIDSEQNQIQCMSKIYGCVWLYKYLNPLWVEQTKYYWESRGEKEYSDFIIAGLT